MVTGLRRLRDNPLVAREGLRWRRRLPWALPLAAAVMLLSCALTNAPLLAALAGESDLTEIAAALLVIGSAVGCLLGLGLFGVQIALPVLAGMSTSQLYSSGLADSLRITLLLGRDVVDGYFVRTLLRFPFWLLIAPLLPLSSSGLWGSTALLGLGSLDTRLGSDTISWIVMLAYPLVATLLALVQLAACVEIGILAGMYNRTPGNAAAVTVGGLFVFQLIIPGGCGLCLSFAGLALLGIYSGSGYTGPGGYPDTIVYTLLATLGTSLIQGLYQLAVFFMARALAAQRFDQSEV